MRSSLALVLAFACATLAGSAAADEAGVKAGMLTCNVEGGVSFIFGSTRDMACTYAPDNTRSERYKGTISKFGVDIGYVSSAVIVWGVIAPTADVAAGALAGDYVGGTASVSAVYGLGAHGLIGGSGNTIGLQPLSLEGNEGWNIAAGIGAMSLKAVE